MTRWGSRPLSPWWGQMPIAADPIVDRLRSLAATSPDLNEAARVYEIILPLLRDADLNVAPLMLTREEARAKMELGLPLLHNLDLALDDQAARDLMIRLAQALESTSVNDHTPKRRLPWTRTREPHPVQLYEHVHAGDDATLRATAAGQLCRGLEQNEIEMSALLAHAAAGDGGYVTALAQGLQLDSALLWTLTQYVLKPALRAWARQLTPLAAGVEWLKGYCFVCGAGATLGELQGNDGIKHLRCGQCGADWISRRMQCIYCGNQDHNTLGYFYPEGEREKLRLEVCDRCKGYLKVITTFEPTPPEWLSVEDLATLHLDYIAQEDGYGRVAIR